LVGPSRLQGARSQANDRTDDSGCPLEERGGERRQRAPGARTLRGSAEQAPPPNEDTSFTRSRDPCTSIATNSKLLASGESPIEGVARWSEYRGRANPREWDYNRHRGFGRRTQRGSPLFTAAWGNSSRSCVRSQKRKVVMATVPARKRESRAQCPYVVVTLQKSAGSILASNKLARSALQKGGGTS
jgi:hypothetical protein